ncbi:MAG: hypothetical protein KF900_03965 [Bacteroidetes bacterium]|nr:hypothetical protein [Bacteroidota bacterium]
MLYKTIKYFLLLSVLFSSCATHSILKRRYTKGYFISSAKKHKETNNKNSVAENTKQVYFADTIKKKIHNETEEPKLIAAAKNSITLLNQSKKEIRLIESKTLTAKTETKHEQFVEQKSKDRGILGNILVGFCLFTAALFLTLLTGTILIMSLGLLLPLLSVSVIVLICFGGSFIVFVLTLIALSNRA